MLILAYLFSSIGNSLNDEPFSNVTFQVRIEMFVAHTTIEWLLLCQLPGAGGNWSKPSAHGSRSMFIYSPTPPPLPSPPTNIFSFDCHTSVCDLNANPSTKSIQYLSLLNAWLTLLSINQHAVPFLKSWLQSSSESNQIIGPTILTSFDNILLNYAPTNGAATFKNLSKTNSLVNIAN